MRRATRPWVFLVMGAALILRFPFIQDGLPFRYNSDENKRIDTAVEMVLRGSWNPGWFGHPAQTIIYPVAALTGSVYGVGRLVGRFEGLEDFAGWYHRDPTVVFVLVRIFMVAVSLAAIALTMLLAAEGGGREASILSGLAVALSPLHLSQSILARSSDIMMSAFVLATVYFSLSILRARKGDTGGRRLLWTYGLAGATVGLSVASKYYGVFGASAVVLAHFLTWGPDLGRMRLLVFSGVASLAAAFVSGPFLFLDFASVLAAVATENRSMHLSANGPGFFTDIAWLLRVLARQGVGPFLFFSAALGAVMATWKNWRESIVVLAPAILILLFLSSLSLRWDRWTLGLVPFVAIFAALPPAWALRWGMHGLHTTRRSIPVLALVVVLFSWNVRAAFRSVTWLGLPDTRDMAGDWIIANLPAHSLLFVEVQGPQLNRNDFRIVGNILDSGDLVILDEDSGGYLHPSPPTLVMNLRSVDDLLRAGVQYVVLTNYEDRLRASPYQDAYRREIGLYGALRSISEEVYSSADGGPVRGPPIRITRVRSSADPSGDAPPLTGE